MTNFDGHIPVRKPTANPFEAENPEAAWTLSHKEVDQTGVHPLIYRVSRATSHSGTQPRTLFDLKFHREPVPHHVEGGLRRGSKGSYPNDSDCEDYGPSDKPTHS